VRAWERLRLLYNVIMVFPGCAVLLRTLSLQDRITVQGDAAGPTYLIGHPLELVAVSLAFGLVANICFCLGPYAEFVITALGYPISGIRSRYFIFGIGMLISLGLVGLVWLYVDYVVVVPLMPAP